MDDIPILGRDGDGYIYNQVLAQYDVPAFIRRAHQVQEAFDQLLSRCRQQRKEWLLMVRIRLGLLQALAGDWNVLRPWLIDESQVQVLDDLQASLQPRLRARVQSTSSPRVLRRALRALTESIGRFNNRWHAFLPTVDLTPVNALREGYNRYYLLEKECAVRSPRLARQGFHRLEPLTREQLAALLPPLPIPQVDD